MGYYIVVKGSSLQGDITILNVLVPNNRASKYTRQKLIEEEVPIDEVTVIVRVFSTPLSEMGRSSRQKICKGIVEFNNTFNQLYI